MACIEGDLGHYDITFYDGGQLKRATVDARSGDVGPGHYESFLRRVLELDVLSDWPESEMLRGGPATRDAPTTILKAVRLAETTGGKALAAHVKTENQRRRMQSSSSPSGESGSSSSILKVQRSARARRAALDRPAV